MNRLTFRIALYGMLTAACLALSPSVWAQSQDNSQEAQPNQKQNDKTESKDRSRSESKSNSESANQQNNENPSSEGQSEGQAMTFDFKDPKGVNTIGFFYNSELEPNFGLASGVSGKITFNPQQPKSFSGAISVDASTLTVANKKMQKDLHSKGWMNVDKFSKITFQFNEVKNVKRNETDGSYTLTVQGRLGLHGASVQKTVPINVMYHEGRAAERGAAESGDLLVLRSTFKVSREDFKIKPKMDNTKVGKEIGIVVGIAGYGPAKKSPQDGQDQQEKDSES